MTILVDVKQVRVAKERIYNYEKSSTSKLHEGKTKVMKLGKARRRNITKTHMNTNFTIMEDTETENYLGDIIGNIVTEEETYEKAIRGIETLGAKWLKEHIGVQGRTIVANTLLQAKLAHRASVNGASKKMQNIIREKIKEFVWGGENKKARVMWEIMLKTPKEGGTGIRDPIIAIEARRISILKKNDKRQIA